MKSIISSGLELKKNQNLIKNLLMTNDIKKLKVIAHIRQVYWNSDYKIWYCNEDARYKKNIYMNRFGLTETPSKMIIQFNIPKNGINRRRQGIFLFDDNNKIFLGHRGTLGNGKGSVLKSSEFNEYSEVVIDDNKKRHVLIIGDINSNNFLNVLSSFIYKINIYNKAFNN